MDRKEFLKKSVTGALVASSIKPHLTSKDKSTFDVMSKDVGFNHLPVEQTKVETHKHMKTVIHKANTRGHANHGWLNTHHSFSFASYRNPDRMNFGMLRVLNDDVVAGGRGFNRHPHDNMEIISIPLSGGLEHQDSLGNKAVIKQGDVQVMSAGTGVYHQEYNMNADQEVRFLQIWMFPNKKDVTPRYDQISIADNKENHFNQILSPSKDDAGVWVHQNAWFHLGTFTSNEEITYQIKGQNNGLYAFVLEGSMDIDDLKLTKRDGVGMWEMDKVVLSPKKGSKILLMEVPMTMG